MRAVQCAGPGGPEVMRVEEMPRPQPGPGEVLIAVHAAGVNRPDLMQRAGKYPPPADASPLLGLEVAGVVAALGAEAPGQLNELRPTGVDGADSDAPPRREPHSTRSRLRIGDPVCALVPGGGYAEYCVAPEAHCLPLPAGITLEEAAGIPETFFTVWANVFQLGRLTAGETLLVHGGTSGIGTTAIQLARGRGAQVIATAGTDEKVQACEQLGAVHAINYRTNDFEQEVLRMTGQRGVDVVLDMIAGSYTAKNIQCLAPYGRLVQIATQHGAEVTINLLKVMQKRLTITGSMMRPRSRDDKATIAHDLYTHVWPLLESGTVRVVVDRIFPLEQVREAHEYLERGTHIGKVILKLRSTN